MTRAALDPLAVTLAIDDAARQRFDDERARLWADAPPHAAHARLFREIPGEITPSVRLDLADAAGPAFAVGVAAVLPLPHGVAYGLLSAELTHRHRGLQESWWPHLTERDQRALRPYIAVQNDVSAARARASVATLRRGFRPYELQATGFVLWQRSGDAWTELERFPFPAPTDLVPS
jgi:hypothetical protein